MVIAGIKSYFIQNTTKGSFRVIFWAHWCTGKKLCRKFFRNGFLVPTIFLQRAHIWRVLGDAEEHRQCPLCEQPHPRGGRELWLSLSPAHNRAKPTCSKRGLRYGHRRQCRLWHWEEGLTQTVEGLNRAICVKLPLDKAEKRTKCSSPKELSSSKPRPF